MKTHVTIGKHEIALFGKDSTETTLRNVLLALDGISFEKKEEQKPFSVDNPPKEGERYWTIHQTLGYLSVGYVPYTGTATYDNGTRAQNNCFRTKEEAEAALSRVLQALKS